MASYSCFCAKYFQSCRHHHLTTPRTLLKHGSSKPPEDMLSSRVAFGLVQQMDMVFCLLLEVKEKALLMCHQQFLGMSGLVLKFDTFTRPERASISCSGPNPPDWFYRVTRMFFCIASLCFTVTGAIPQTRSTSCLALLKLTLAFLCSASLKESAHHRTSHGYFKGQTFGSNARLETWKSMLGIWKSLQLEAGTA